MKIKNCLFVVKKSKVVFASSLPMNHKNELNEIKGESQNIEFGSQIRSYVLHPYSMIKDHRTNTETSNVNKVLDGDIDMFIEDNLKRGK